MMHPDHFQLVRILVLAGLTAVIGEKIAKVSLYLFQ